MNQEFIHRVQAKFVPDPIFANIVLADDTNRASPMAQSAVLETMSEDYVTFDANVE